MAEDWGKWQKEWDKIEPKTRNLTLARGRKLLDILKARDKLLEKHEKDFRTVLKAAVEAGATGTDYKAFEGKKGVPQAKALLDEDVRLVAQEVNEVNLYCKECDALFKPIDKLTDAMGRAIKSTKEKSAERDKAKKLFDAIETKRKELGESADLHFKVDAFLRELPKQYPAWIKLIVTEAVKGGKAGAEKEAEKAAAVAGIDEKSLKAAVATIEKMRLKMEKPLMAAQEAFETDLKKAADFVKQGQSELAKIKKFAAEVKALGEKKKKEIAAAKDAKKLQGYLGDVAEIAEGAGADFKTIADDFKAAMAKKK